MKGRIKILSSIAALLAVLTVPLHSGDKADPMRVSLSIDQEAFGHDEAVILHVSIQNTSQKTVTFEIYEDKNVSMPDFTTFQPVVYDMEGREAENIIPYRKENRPTSEVIKKMKRRTVSLGTGETFTHDINLRRVYNLEKGIFRVRSYFIPDFKARNLIYSVNELTFRIIGDDRGPGPFGKEEMKRTTEITPGEIVLLCLEAEKREEWKRMFKYIEMKEFIYSYNNFVRPYNSAGPKERREILGKFKQFLARHRHDYIVNFTIADEEIEKNRKYATVTAVVERYGVRRNERYKYMYRLSREGSIWLLNAVEASVLKGIAK